MKITTLTASSKSFTAHEPASSVYINAKTLLSRSDLFSTLPLRGYKVVQNVFDTSDVMSLRDLYFSSFSKDCYQKNRSEWQHLSNCTDSHGVGSHPSKAFVRNPTFIEFINSSILNRISSLLLDCQRAVLCPRVIVRSFSHLSSRCTFAHRDREYFNTPSISSAITAWIPLGPVDTHHGQLVYLRNSENKAKLVNKFVRKDRTLSNDLAFIASYLSTTWDLPIINIGDVVFHCMDVVHASFDSKNLSPRLSCDLRFAINELSIDPKWNSFWSGDDGL